MDHDAVLEFEVLPLEHFEATLAVSKTAESARASAGPWNLVGDDRGVLATLVLRRIVVVANR